MHAGKLVAKNKSASVLNRNWSPLHMNNPYHFVPPKTQIINKEIRESKNSTPSAFSKLAISPDLYPVVTSRLIFSTLFKLL